MVGQLLKRDGNVGHGVKRNPEAEWVVRGGHGRRGCGGKESFVPVRPHPVHHAVMDIEGRIAWAGEEVGARITALESQSRNLDDRKRWCLPDGVMDAPVRANFLGVRHTFRQRPVGGGIWLCQKPCERFSVCVQPPATAPE